MKSLAKQMAQYQYYHQKSLTKLTHFFGVPLLVFAFFIPLSWLHWHLPVVGEVNLGWLSIGLLTAYYLWLSPKIALSLSAVLALLGYGAAAVSRYHPNFTATLVFALALLAGIVLQWVGHVIEGKKPALADDLSQIFIAPIFLWVELLFSLGALAELKAEVARQATPPKQAA